MRFQHFAGAAYRALTVRKHGPSLYEVCDPLLLRPAGGDLHLAKFYQTAIGNPGLRALLRRTGIPELREETRLEALREALIRARDDTAPDWAAIGAPIAALLDGIDLRHPKPKPATWSGRPPGVAEIELVIRPRSAYYDAFYTEALLSFVKTGLASPEQTKASRRAISEMIEFCLTTSREQVRAQDGRVFDVVTALAPPPHPRFSRFFAQIKQDLGFGVYVPDCDTTRSEERRVGKEGRSLSTPDVC